MKIDKVGHNEKKEIHDEAIADALIEVEKQYCQRTHIPKKAAYRKMNGE